MLEAYDRGATTIQAMCGLPLGSPAGSITLMRLPRWFVLWLVGFIIYRLPGVYTRYDRRTGLGCGRCMLHRQLSLRIGRLDDSQAPMLGRYRSHVGVDVSRGR